MNITDADGLWRITSGEIENRTTGEVRRVVNLPSGNAIAYMPYSTFLRKCQIAFDTGEWPEEYRTLLQ